MTDEHTSGGPPPTAAPGVNRNALFRGQADRLSAFFGAALAEYGETLLVTDDRGRFVYVASNSHATLGFSPEETTAMGSIDELCKRLGLPLSERLASGSHEVDFEDRRGRRRRLEVRSAAGMYRVRVAPGLPDEDGEPPPSRRSAERSAASDELDQGISEPHEAQKDIAETLELHEKILSTAAVGIVTFARDGRCVTANEAGAAMVGATREDLLKQNFREILSWKDSGLSETAEAVLEDGVSRTIEVKLDTSFGKSVQLDCRLSRFTVGGESRLLVVSADVSEHKETLRDVRDTKKTIEALLNATRDAAVLFGADGRIRALNQRFAEEMNLDEGPFMGRSIYGFKTFAMTPRRRALFDRVIDEGKPLCSHEEIDGKLFLVSLYPVNHMDGRVAAVAAFARDVTAQKRAEAALRESEDTLRSILSASPVGIALAENRIIKWANQAWASMFGFRSERDFVDKRSRMVFASDEEYDRAVSGLCDNLKPGDTVGADVKLKRADGSVFDGHLRLRALDSYETGRGVIAVTVDISDHKRSEERIKTSLAEKEALLREIHHRVKNNLQVVSSLLGLQSDYVADEYHLSMFKEAEMRVKTLALIHEMLYQSTNLAFLNLQEYLESLLEYLTVSFEGTIGAVTYAVDAGETVLDADTAIPLGFIVTELYANCLKHAFPDGGEGRVTITLTRKDADAYELIVKDDGVGLPADFDPRNPDSLGLDLVLTFVEQLKGRLEIDGASGTEVRIAFTLSHRARRR